LIDVSHVESFGGLIEIKAEWQERHKKETERVTHPFERGRFDSAGLQALA
jgi:hypothetical protein